MPLQPKSDVNNNGEDGDGATASAAAAVGGGTTMSCKGCIDAQRVKEASGKVTLKLPRAAVRREILMGKYRYIYSYT